MNISVQLYTLRSLLEKDFWGTMEAVAKVGFKNVELAGLYGQSAEEVRSGLAGLGIRARSMHTSFDAVRDHFDSVVEEAHTLGLRDVVIPWLDIGKFNGWKDAAAQMTDMAIKLKPHEIILSYHNHDFEFQLEDGRPGFEVLWENAGPSLHAELDLYWVTRGGGDPVKWINRLGKRVRLSHYKDMDEEGGFAQVGQGKLDWRSIIAANKKAGTLYAVIENDSPKIDPVEAVRQSREFLLAQGLKD